MSLTEYDEEEAKKVFHDDGYKEGFNAGRSEGAAVQKAKDEKIIQEITTQKDAEIEQKTNELAKQAEEIAILKAQLAQKKRLTKL